MYLITDRPQQSDRHTKHTALQNTDTSDTHIYTFIFIVEYYFIFTVQ
jgi:hypothetical protein